MHWTKFFVIFIFFLFNIIFCLISSLLFHPVFPPSHHLVWKIRWKEMNEHNTSNIQVTGSKCTKRRYLQYNSNEFIYVKMVLLLREEIQIQEKIQGANEASNVFSEIHWPMLPLQNSDDYIARRKALIALIAFIVTLPLDFHLKMWKWNGIYNIEARWNEKLYVVGTFAWGKCPDRQNQKKILWKFRTYTGIQRTTTHRENFKIIFFTSITAQGKGENYIISKIKWKW